MIKLVKVKILDDITVRHDGRYYIKYDVIEMTEKEAENLAKNIKIEIVKDNTVKISDGMDSVEIDKYRRTRAAEEEKAKRLNKPDSNELEKLLAKMKGQTKSGNKARFFYLWAHEPVKIWSEAKYFHNKPPAMRVCDKSL